MEMQLVSLKMPADMVADVRKMSHIESLKRGRSLTFSGLVREVVAEYVRRESQRGAEPAAVGRS